ncbi:MAG: glycoside hydrolase family 127 protein, partial [Clostridia bacterium]|nr:glycoside hydrolase family 127 protein [Clostridia bacterium]
KSLFRTNGQEAHLFGLEPNYGCCTANFNQAWPKFALSVFMHNGNEVINSVPVPSELKTDDKHIIIETNYPFENSFKYTVESKNAFVFKIRVPSFAKNLTVDGELICSDELSFNVSTGEKRVIVVSFDTKIRVDQRPHSLNTVRCGSLVFSVPVKYETNMLEYERDGVERKFPYCDYELIPVSDWNYAYCSDDFELCRNAMSDVPFSSKNPSVTVKAYVKKINWGYEDGYDTVCAKIPESREPVGEKEEIILYPYGCAKLRMTELPIIT